MDKLCDFTSNYRFISTITKLNMYKYYKIVYKTKYIFIEFLHISTKVGKIGIYIEYITHAGLAIPAHNNKETIIFIYSEYDHLRLHMPKNGQFVK